MKRTYQPPTIEVIKVDNEISLVLCSDHHHHHGHHISEQEFEEENEFNNENVWK